MQAQLRKRENFRTIEDSPSRNGEMMTMQAPTSKRDRSYFPTAEDVEAYH